MAKKVVMWPESQALMEKEGFGGENCKLINGNVGLEVYGSSAYLVDEDWEETAPEGDEDEELDEDNFCIAEDDELLEYGLLTDEDFDPFNEEEDDDIDYEDEDYEEDY